MAVPGVATASVERTGYERSALPQDATASASGGGRRLLTAVSWAAAGWALGYAAYRGYYARGGTGFLPGTPAPGGSSGGSTPPPR